jgi:hypothetical protein
MYKVTMAMWQLFQSLLSEEKLQASGNTFDQNFIVMVDNSSS